MAVDALRRTHCWLASSCATLGRQDSARLHLTPDDWFAPVRMNDCDKAGNTAVHYATCNSRGGILQLLLEAGGEPDTKTTKSWPPLTLLRPRAPPCMSVLIEFGADFEA